MFSGIVEELGTVASRSDGRIVVRCSTVPEDSAIGSSVAVNGVCLTVVENDGAALAFDLSEETIRRTTLGELGEGSPVNLERPVTLATRLGGHLVQGHVDGVGRIAQTREAGDGLEMTIEAPDDVMRYVVEKGSITVDGVSLTIAQKVDGRFGVALIPHTLAVTTLGTAGRNDLVNLEADVIAKYVEGLLAR
jgi:riboflavin synthase